MRSETNENEPWNSERNPKLLIRIDATTRNTGNHFLRAQQYSTTREVAIINVILTCLVIAFTITPHAAAFLVNVPESFGTKSINCQCGSRNIYIQQTINNNDLNDTSAVTPNGNEVSPTSSLGMTTTMATFPPVKILDQNEYYMVIEKPPSVVCHHSPWVGSRKRKRIESTTMVPAAEIPILQRVREQTGRRVNLVHRLDRGSSGCLLLTFADDMATTTNEDLPSRDQFENNISATSSLERNKLPINSTRATAILSEAMADKESCTKTYIALVRGEGILRGEDLKQKGWFFIDRAIKNENGVSKNATTWFCFVAGQDNNSGTIDRPRASLVLARPQTGRWHQIRKHLNGLSHPILGDTTHGSSRTNREWKERRNMLPERTCLHLSQIVIGPTEVCPNGINVTCPLASDMMQLFHDHLPAVLSTAIPILKEEGIFLTEGHDLI